MTYQEFQEKNRANERIYKKALKRGTLNSSDFEKIPYMCFSINKVYKNDMGYVAEISSKTGYDFNGVRTLDGIIDMIMNSTNAKYNKDHMDCLQDDVIFLYFIGMSLMYVLPSFVADK